MKPPRFFPASVCVSGDTRSDRVVLDEVNTLLKRALAADGSPVDRYALQHLDPSQFVLEPAPEREWEPPGGLVRPLRPGSVLARPSRRKRRR